MNSKRLFQIFILASACILLCFGCTRGAEQTDVPADTPQAVQTPVGQDEDVVTILPADGKDNAPATVPPEVEAPQPTPKPTEAPSKQTPAATAEPTATAAATPKATAKPTSKPSGKKTPKPTAKTTPKPTATAAPTATPPASDLRAQDLIGVWKLDQILYNGSIVDPGDVSIEITVEFFADGSVRFVSVTDGNAEETAYTYTIDGDTVRLLSLSGKETLMTYHADKDEISFSMMEDNRPLELYLMRDPDAFATPTPASGSPDDDIELPEIP